MSLLLISFIAGIVTVLSPCILPLLPVIVGGSLTSNRFSKSKVFVVTSSLAISILLFTFFLKVSTLFVNVPEIVWQTISGVIVIIIGIVTYSPKLLNYNFISDLNSKANILIGKGEGRGDFIGNVIIGFALGPVFTTCSPTYFIVLATVLPVSLFVGSIYIVSYIIGLCISLCIIIYLSQKVLNKLGVLVEDGSILKRLIGLVFIIIGVLIITGADKKLQISILNFGLFDVTKIEQKLLSDNSDKNKESESLIKNIPEQIIIKENNMIGKENTIKKMESKTLTNKEVMNKNIGLILAPDISTPDGYINTTGEDASISRLRGKKVVLVSFWTFSCINCKRTLPYLNTWYDKYKDQGLEIISIHTPEFAFERVLENVQNAVTTQNIKYPVILDNDYSTWKSYDNNYWPRKYLINKDGYIVYDHAGEGAYEETENEIVKALKDLNNGV